MDAEADYDPLVDYDVYDNGTAYPCLSEVPTTKELFSGFDVYGYVGIALCCSVFLVTMALYIEEIVFLVKYFRANRGRRVKTTWILAVFPVFSLTNLLAIIVPRSTVIADIFSNIYFSSVLYQFFSLMLNYVGGRDRFWDIPTVATTKVSMRAPPCCCCCMCLPVLPLTRKVFRKLSILVLQVCIFRPVLLFIAAVLWTNGTYVPGGSMSGNAFPYIMALNLVSSGTAVYGLAILNKAFGCILKGIHVEGKLFVLQLILVTGLIPKILINVLVSANVIGCNEFFPSPARGERINNVVMLGFTLIYAIIGRIYYRRAADATASVNYKRNNQGHGHSGHPGVDPEGGGGDAKRRTRKPIGQKANKKDLLWPIHEENIPVLEGSPGPEMRPGDPEKRIMEPSSAAAADTPEEEFETFGRDVAGDPVTKVLEWSSDNTFTEWDDDELVAAVVGDAFLPPQGAKVKVASASRSQATPPKEIHNSGLKLKPTLQKVPPMELAMTGSDRALSSRPQSTLSPASSKSNISTRPQPKPRNNLPDKVQGKPHFGSQGKLSQPVLLSDGPSQTKRPVSMAATHQQDDRVVGRTDSGYNSIDEKARLEAMYALELPGPPRSGSIATVFSAAAAAKQIPRQPTRPTASKGVKASSRSASREILFGDEDGSASLGSTGKQYRDPNADSKTARTTNESIGAGARPRVANPTPSEQSYGKDSSGQPHRADSLYSQSSSVTRQPRDEGIMTSQSSLASSQFPEATNRSQRRQRARERSLSRERRRSQAGSAVDDGTYLVPVQTPQPFYENTKAMREPSDPMATDMMQSRALSVSSSTPSGVKTAKRNESTSQIVTSSTGGSRRPSSRSRQSNGRHGNAPQPGGRDGEEAGKGRSGHGSAEQEGPARSRSRDHRHSRDKANAGQAAYDEQPGRGNGREAEQQKEEPVNLPTSTRNSGGHRHRSPRRRARYSGPPPTSQ